MPDQPKTRYGTRESDLIGPSRRTLRVLIPLSALVVLVSIRRLDAPAPRESFHKRFDYVPAEIVFTVRGDDPGRFRIGTLDTYEEGTWREGPAPFAFVGREVSLQGAQVPEIAPTGRAFVIARRELRLLPVPPGFTRIQRSNMLLSGGGIDEIVRAAESGAARYEVLFRAVPEEILARAPRLDGQTRRRLADAGGSEPPKVARALVRAVHERAGRPWRAALFLRDELRRRVRVSMPTGGSRISPADVSRVLRTRKGTTYEALGIHALICRWADVPCRIAFGYEAAGESGGDYRSRHAAQWLELYVTGVGWTPVPGTSRRG